MMDRKGAEPQAGEKEKRIQEEIPVNSDTANGNDRTGQTPTGRRRQWKGRRNRIRSPSTCPSVNSCDSAQSDYSCQYLNADSYEKNVSLCRKCLFTYFEFNNVANVIYMRHGARTPKKKIQNVWPFKEGKGDLTFLGFQQSVRIGKYLRKYYYSMRKLNSIYNGGESASNMSTDETNRMGKSTPWDKRNQHKLKEHMGRRGKNFKETIKLLVSKKSTCDDPCRILHKRVAHKMRWTPFYQDGKRKEPTVQRVRTNVCANYCMNKKRKRRKRKKKKNEKVINVDHSMGNEVPSEAALRCMHPLDGGAPIGCLNKDAIDYAQREKDKVCSTCEANYLQKQLKRRINIEKQKRKYDRIVKTINNYLCVKTTSNYDLLDGDMISGSGMLSDHFRSVSGKREDRLHPLSIPQKHLPNSNSILERRKSSLHAGGNFFSQQKDSSVDTHVAVRPDPGTHLLPGCHPLGCLQGGSYHHVNSAPIFPNPICNFTEKNCEGHVHTGEHQQLREVAQNCITHSGESGSPDRVRYHSHWIGSNPRGEETPNGGKCPQNFYSLFVNPPTCQWVSSMEAFTDGGNTGGFDRCEKMGAKMDLKMGVKMDEAKLLLGVTSNRGVDAPIVEKKPEDESYNNRPNGRNESSNRGRDAPTGDGANWKAENAQSYSDSVNPSWGVLKRSLAKGAARKGTDKFRPSSTLIHNVKTFFEFVLSGRYNSELFYDKIMKAKGRNERKLEKSCIFFIFECYMRYVLSGCPGYGGRLGDIPRMTHTDRDGGISSGHPHEGCFVSPPCMANSTPHRIYPRNYRRNLLSYLRNIYVLCSVVNVAERNSLMLKTLKSNNHYIKRLKNLIFYNSNVYKLLNDYYKEEVSIVYQITKWNSRTYLNRSELLLSEPWANITQSDVTEDESNLKNRIVKILKKHNSAVYKIKKKLNRSIILKDLRKLNYYSVGVSPRNASTCEQRKLLQEKIRSMRNHLLFYRKRKNIKIIKQFISSYHSYVYHNVRLVLDMRKAYRNVEVECGSSSGSVLGVATPEVGKKEPPTGGESHTRKERAFREVIDPSRWYYSMQKGGAQDGAEKWPHLGMSKGSLDLCEPTPDDPSNDSPDDPPDGPPDDPPDNPRSAKRTDETAEKKEKNKEKNFYKKIYECYKHMCTLEYNNKYLSWLCSGMSLMDVVINFLISVRVYENFNRELAATAWGGGKKLFIPKIIVYLTHQSSILSFQSCVGVKRSSMKIPPFGGFLSLELVHIRKKGGDKHRQTSSKVISQVTTKVNAAQQMDSKTKGHLEQLCGTHPLGDLPLSNSPDEPTSPRQNLPVTGETRSADRHNVQTFIRENDTASIFCCKEDCVWKVKRSQRNADGNSADRTFRTTTMQTRKKGAREDKYESYLPKCTNKIQNFKNLFNVLCYRDSNVGSNIETLIQLYNVCLSDNCSYVGNTELKGGQEGQGRRRRHFYGYFVKFTFNHYFPLKLKRKKCIKKCRRGGREETGQLNGSVKEEHQGEEEIHSKVDTEEGKKSKDRHTNWEERKENPPGEVTNMKRKKLPPPKGKVLPSVVGRKEKRFDTKGEKPNLETRKCRKETYRRGEFPMKNTHNAGTDHQSDDSRKGKKQLRRNKIMQRLNMNSFTFESKHDKYMHYVYNSSDLKYGKIYSKLNKESDSKFSTKKSVDINNRLMERSRVKLNGGGSSFSSEESTHDELELRNWKFKSLGRGEDAGEYQVNSVNCPMNDHLYHLRTNEVDVSQQNCTPMGYSIKLSKRGMSSKLLKNCIMDETEKRKRKKMQKMQKTKPGFNRKKDESDKRNYQNENIICLDCLISYLRQMLRVYGNPEML
ncbi:Uncharacterized protein PCOAH_00008650 [Plasmodium coatneyi]|uniref:Uncharacterized protein n=1 Tax=Plasmodium coatneyi TaxID=208452 RepID=A0A1B1DUM2_9APIC|nr:Uncharacterized protein PCOAH_00008650 [Plasmodium coatneyi]ANQ06473.1 Uncharacterized protein PCOAH_00008650 [Plasmodium coatneyi]